MERNGAYRSEKSTFTSQSPTAVGKPSVSTTTTVDLLRNPTLANDFFQFATALQCSLGSLYLAMTMALIRDCWAQQQQIRNAKSKLLEELTLRPSIRDKALEFVDAAISLQTETFQAVAREDSLFFAERVVRAQWDSLHRSMPCPIDIAYHLSKQGEKSLQKYIEDGAQGEGLLCSSNPLRFDNQGDEEDTILVLARIGGSALPIDPIEETVGVTTMKPLKGFYNIRDSKECVPLFYFSPMVLEERRGRRFEKQLMYFQVQVQHLLENVFKTTQTPKVESNKPPSLSLGSKVPAAAVLARIPANIRNDDRARRRFMQSQAFKAYKAQCASDHRNKVISNSSEMMYNLPQQWSQLETPGMRTVKCSLLIQQGDRFDPRVKTLSKQRVRVYQDKGYIPDAASDEPETNEDDHFVVDFEGCKILQLEPSRRIRRQTMPTTLTVGGRCTFTAENYRNFRVMMRTKEQSNEMHLLPNGDFDWPDVDSLRLCPCCGRTADIPKDDDDQQSQEYWLVFYPLLQIMVKQGCRMVLGSRMICRLTCLDCMHKLLGETTCTICPPLLNERKAKTTFTLTTKEVLAKAGSISFLEGVPPRPETHPNMNDVLDAWTLYNLWENSGAWEALQNDYRDYLSASMASS